MKKEGKDPSKAHKLETLTLQGRKEIKCSMCDSLSRAIAIKRGQLTLNSQVISTAVIIIIIIIIYQQDFINHQL